MNKTLFLIALLLVGCSDPVIDATLRGNDAGLMTSDRRCLSEMPRYRGILQMETKETLAAYRKAYLAACQRKHSAVKPESATLGNRTSLPAS